MNYFKYNKKSRSCKIDQAHSGFLVAISAPTTHRELSELTRHIGTCNLKTDTHYSCSRAVKTGREHR